MVSFSCRFISISSIRKYNDLKVSWYSSLFVFYLVPSFFTVGLFILKPPVIIDGWFYDDKSCNCTTLKKVYHLLYFFKRILKRTVISFIDFFTAFL